MLRVLAAIFLATTLLAAPACYTARLGAGLAGDTDGHPSLQLTASVGLGSTGTAVSTALVVGIRRTRVTYTPLLVLSKGWENDHAQDVLPRRIIAAELRLGERVSPGDAPDAPDATVVGLGFTYLRAVGGRSGAGRDHCVWFGLGSEHLHSIGIAASVDLHHGEDDHSLGQATLSFVYQLDSYVVGSDCGD